MLQGANTDLYNPLVPKAHNSDRVSNLLFPFKLSQKKSDKVNFADFYFCTLGTNGLIKFF